METSCTTVPLGAALLFVAGDDTLVFGKLTAVRKAAKFGYRKYGLPGAVVAGVGGLVGYRFVRRKLGSRNRRE
ncbi:hypothetical protein BRC86_13600 [Halobacteriales archaeon QS_3_64_16]|nr:MAG: hypothetical protein BRC86_13600 [Halobacteriales archaeon QS_3_64_16]